MPPPATQRDIGSDQPTQGQVTIKKKKDTVGLQLKWIVKGKNAYAREKTNTKRGKTTTERRCRKAGIGGEAGRFWSQGAALLPRPETTHS